MIERELHVSTDDGAMRLFAARPEAGGPCPIVFIFMDFWGYRDELHDIARRIAAVGYYAVVPDFYHRVGDAVLNQFRNAEGRTLSVFNLNPDQLAKAAEPLKTLTDTMVLEDVAQVLAFLAEDSAASDGPVGAVGYCMGGRQAIEAAARWPDRFRATACIHGSYLISDRPESPHLDLERLQGELYCGHAEHDLTAADDMIGRFDALLAQCSVKVRSIVHPDAYHGYALQSRDVYDRDADGRDWELIFAMFHRQLRPYGGCLPD